LHRGLFGEIENAGNHDMHRRTRAERFGNGESFARPR
jgi:hypothetical protein